MPVGTKVRAAHAGKVVATDWGDAYGIHVVIQSKGGTVRHAYCHLSKVTVKPGDKVERGDVIGRTGNTGRSTGPHLHYEERWWPYRYGRSSRAPRYVNGDLT